MRWLVLLLAAGCAGRPRPTYVPLDLPLPEPPEESEEQVRDSVAWALERGRMPRLRWSPSTGLPERELAADELHEVPPELLWTAWVCNARSMWGSELDVLVQTADAPIPVTVRVDVDGGVHLRQGRDLPTLPTVAEDREARMIGISRRHGLGGVVDGSRRWDADELDAVDRALELLDPRERLLLEGLVISRDVHSGRDVRELALYDPLVQPVTIHVYDGAFAAGQWSFVGPLEAPTPAPVMTLVHEFGHAISDAPLTDAWQRLVHTTTTHQTATPGIRRQTREDMVLARRDLRSVGRRGPVIRSFAELRPGRLWPTAWSTDVFESFAEAFALYRTDPDALLRVAPEAWQWFEDDGHLAWRHFPG